MTSSDLISVLPVIILVAWACLLLILDAFVIQKRVGATAFLAAAGPLVVVVLTFIPFEHNSTGFNEMIAADPFSRFLTALFAGSGLVGIALAHRYLERMNIARGEFYPLLLFSISGMVLMSMATDLIVIFLALELLSIPLYVLAGFARPEPASEEASLKYFLLGAFAGGFVVYGVAFIYGAVGSTALTGVVAAVAQGAANMPLLVIGGALILIGMGFKVAVVPFHMWTPDVYQGAPSPLTAFMAVGAKAAGFAALLRIFLAALPDLAPDLTPIIWGLAALTMFLGNVVAIAQKNIKRMLAYSSIAHAGYIMMAFVPFGDPLAAEDMVASALFYLFAYGVTNFGAWAVVITMEGKEGKGLAIQDYDGMGKKYPLLSACMTVFMLSFTGVPPTLGFVGKLYLFRTVILGEQYALAIIGVITSLISAYYYLNVVVRMYMREGDPDAVYDPWVRGVTIATALAAVLLSIFSLPLFRWVSGAVIRIF